jgi:glycosyltransferase involved in cell wall biosynthesis
MNPAQGPLPRGAVGAVVIGRNEGQRLRACLASLAGKAFALVYVESGSSDGSVALARQMGAEVVELDPATPFTAARSRNAGWSRLCEISSDI